MPASKHMVVVEKRRILERRELMAGRDHGSKTNAGCRPAENRSRDARSRAEKASVSNDS
jgi:hypothetical protein